MKPYDIEFSLNNTEKIIIQLEEPLDHVSFIYFVPILFVSGDSSYSLYDGEVGITVYGYMQDLECILESALKNKLQLSESLKSDTKDIGYFFNEARQERSDVFDKAVITGTSSDGMRCMLLADEVIAWIYNDNNGDISFKLTPSFPGRSMESFFDETDSPEAVENSKWYDEWIKAYEPILTRKIPRDVAQQWLANAQEIIATIQANDRRWLMEYEASK